MEVFFILLIIIIFGVLSILGIYTWNYYYVTKNIIGIQNGGSIIKKIKKINSFYTLFIIILVTSIFSVYPN